MPAIQRLSLRRALAAVAVASFAAALFAPAIATGPHPGGLRGWALLLGGRGESPAAFGIAWAGAALLALTAAWQARGRAAAPTALAGLLVAAFGWALAPQDWRVGAWLWAAALGMVWIGSLRGLDAPPQAGAQTTPARRWRPSRRFWLAAGALWLAVGLRDRAIDLFVPADDVRRTTAGPIDAVELLRQGDVVAPVLARADLAAVGYREVVIGTRRYRAAAGPDAYFAMPAEQPPRWLVVERWQRPEDFWTRRLRRFMSVRIVDRERNETIATWHGPVRGRGADAEQAAAFVRSVLPPGPPAGAPKIALRATVRTEPPAVAGRRPASRTANCPPDVRLVDARGPTEPDRGEELVSARWVYGLAGGIGSVFCDVADTLVEHGGQPSEHRIDRIDPAGQSVRRLVASDPVGAASTAAQPATDAAEARLVEARAARDALSVRKRYFASAAPHAAVRDVVIDFEPPVVERPPTTARKPSGRRRAAERARQR